MPGPHVPEPPGAAPRTIGPYTILGQLGRGGMGVVYRAHDARLQRDVALKVIADFDGDPLRLERFMREARAASALNHPHILSVYDGSLEGPLPYVVTELIEGGSLRQLHGSGPLPLKRLLDIAVQIADGLAAAHRAQLVHRDLKPENVMLTRDGRVKIIDFGLARAAPAAVTSPDTLTVPQVIAGTVPYMSPEQARGEAVDFRSDLFSFGAMLYEMATGRRAFDRATAVDTLTAIMRDEPPPVRERNPRVPVALSRIIARCLAKSVDDRYGATADLLHDLQTVRGDSPAPGEQPAGLEPSIAVLPFANMSGDSANQYFSDGLSEEIINALAQVPGLKVTARTSAFAFRGKEQDIMTIAAALRVRTILEGSVRWSGRRVRVTAQLINAADGYHLWSDRYDREMTDAFALQDEIAQAIAVTLQGKLNMAPATRRYTPSPAAYEAYLKARYSMGPGQLLVESLDRARVLIDQAIELDPGFALARQLRATYFFLQSTWGQRPAHEMMPLARRSAEDALACDAVLPEAHASLGVIAGLYDYDWAEQERRFRLAMPREPVSPDVRASYGMNCLLLTGRAAEAVTAIRRALEEDPLNSLFRVHLAICLDAAGAVAEAERELLQVLEINDRYGPATEWLALHCAFRGRWQEAAGYAERTLAIAGRKTRFVGLLAGVLMHTGGTGQAGALLSTLRGGEAFGAPTELMIFHLLQSDADAAAGWAEQAIQQRDPYFAVLMATLVGAALRLSPRGAQISQAMRGNAAGAVGPREGGHTAQEDGRP